MTLRKSLKNDKKNWGGNNKKKKLTFVRLADCPEMELKVARHTSSNPQVS